MTPVTIYLFLIASALMVTFVVTVFNSCKRVFVFIKIAEDNTTSASINTGKLFTKMRDELTTLTSWGILFGGALLLILMLQLWH